LQVLGENIADLCRQHPLLLAISGAVLREIGSHVARWSQYVDHFERFVTRQHPDTYRLHLAAAVEMSLAMLQPDSCELFFSLGASRSSSIPLVRFAT